MDTFVFAVGTKKAMARLQKEMQDLVNILYLFCHVNIIWTLFLRYHTFLLVSVE